MARAFRKTGGEAEPASYDHETRIPAAGTWLGLGVGIMIVLAVFAWTII
jgi:hypothetical protein